MIPEAGRRYGPYEIQTRLGGGGMGHVFRAWDARLHREVALKLLHSDFVMPGMRERFLREARAASGLNHPNICTIFDIGEQDGEPYLVMELLHGETLKDRIEDRTIQVDELIRIATEIAEALSVAHAKGVVHRDIKPANIFLVDRPNQSVQAKVLDFGLAKIEGGVLGARGRALDITTAGSTVGTLAYMSPEQARGESLDSRSDLFSLGVVMYEMATRHIPFQGATSALVFVQLLNHPPEPVREWNDSIPRELERIIFKLLAKDPTARFQTAAEVEQALLRLNEKGAAPGWLRKAVATVPLVRAADPVARERRPSNYRSVSQINPAKSALESESHVETTPAHKPLRSHSASSQVIRPVARVPQGDTTPRPAATPQPAPANSKSARTEPFISTTPMAPQLSPSSEEALPTDLHVPADAVETPDPPAMDSEPLIETEALPAVQLPPQPPAPAVLEQPRRVTRPFIYVNRPWLYAIAGCAIIAAVAAGVVVVRGRFGPTLIAATDPVIVTEIENQTGNRILDGTLAVALNFALQQSPFLRLRTLEEYELARRRQADPNAQQAAADSMGAARNASRAVGARAFFHGYVQGATAPYTLHVELRDTNSGEMLTFAEEQVASLEQMPNAIDRVAETLRSNSGESSDSISRAHVALSQEATANLEALHYFAVAQYATRTGKTLDVLRAYQDATRLEPRFVQGQIELTVINRRLRAETEAAESARLALAASESSSDRLRSIAQYEFEMNTSGDYVRATSIIRHVIDMNPHDAESLARLARTLRLQGHIAEALKVAQAASTEDPFLSEPYLQAANALIGLDRYDAALQMNAQVQRLGIDRPGEELSAAFLAKRPELVLGALTAIVNHQSAYRPDWNYGLYLDNTGQMAAGAALWRSRAAQSQEVRGIDSAAGFLLSQGALDRALIGNCVDGLAMAHESDDRDQGLVALYNTGMAVALCGDSRRAQQIVDELKLTYPSSYFVNGFYLADIRAAMALHVEDPELALEVLRPARQFDLISLTPLLRGRAHVALRQVQIGIVDYQTVLSHRGITFIVGSDVYPVAAIGVARAFAETGDLSNSAESYRHFLALWEAADIAQPLRLEAQAFGAN